VVREVLADLEASVDQVVLAVPVVPVVRAE
jgi:hypothetical protein